MKGFVVVTKFWTRFFSGGRAVAVTIFPFIFVISQSHKNDEVLLRHERIHICQVLELGILPFYLWYLFEFLFNYIRYGNFQKAYLFISFEQEAYAHELDADYLKTRKCWAFLSYYRKA